MTICGSASVVKNITKYWQILGIKPVKFVLKHVYIDIFVISALKILKKYLRNPSAICSFCVEYIPAVYKPLKKTTIHNVKNESARSGRDNFIKVDS